MNPRPNIIILTESSLNCDIKDCELGLVGYRIFRYDRHNFSNSPAGGGILIAVDKNFLSNIVQLSFTNDCECEQLFVEISINNLNYIIGGVYIPPRRDVINYRFHKKSMKELTNKFPLHRFLICGDFNLPYTQWSNDDFLSANYTGNDSLVEINGKVLKDCYSSHGFWQHYPIHPDKGYTLDLLFTSSLCNFKIIPSFDSLVRVEAHNHIPICGELSDAIFAPIKPESFELNFNKANYAQINSELQKVDWVHEISSLDLESSCKFFYDKINGICIDNVPRLRSSNSTYPRWYSDKLIGLIISKKKTHKIWLQSENYSDRIAYFKLRAQCIRQSRSDHDKYLDSIEKRSVKNVKNFWNYINNLNKTNEIPGNMYLSGVRASGPKICDLFASHFKSVYNAVDDDDMLDFLPNVVNSIFIENSDIKSAIDKMKPSFSITSDGLPSIFLKKCASSLEVPLAILFNTSLCNGVVPKIWKTSFITPIFKAGDRSDITNYRPITMLGSVAKLLDSIVAEKLSDLLIGNIVKSQHAFLKGKSTLTNLLVYTSYISEMFAVDSQVDVVYLDFSKAFDKVDVKILLMKLRNFGLGGTLLSWIYSYLNSRVQRVRLKGHLSDPFVVESGVPQGSHVGPLLFLLFINDLGDRLVNSQILVFADDVKLFYKIETIMDSIKLQSDLDVLSEWAVINKLDLNINKCKYISFNKSKLEIDFSYTINGIFLERVSSIVDLGVMFDSNLKFDLHLESVTTKARSLLYFIIRATKEFKNPNTFIYLYKTIVLPHLLYCSQIWSPFYDNNIVKLEKVNHKFLRYLAFKAGCPMNHFDHDYEVVAKRFSIPSVKSLHNYYDLFFAFKVIKKFICSEDVNKLFQFRDIKFNIRNPRQLLEIRSRDNQSYFSAINRLRRNWNLSPATLRNCNSLNLFKKECKSYSFQYI